MAVDRDVTLLVHLAKRSDVTIVETTVEEFDLPSATLDLIHTRNALMHIDGADVIIARLVDALRPGGCPVLEEADYFPLAGMTSPALYDAASALVAKWTGARTMRDTVSQLPVCDIDVTIDTSMLRGRSPKAAFWIHTFRSVRHRLTAPELAASNGCPSVTQATFGEPMTLLGDQTFWTPLAAVVCVSCKRCPATA